MKTLGQIALTAFSKAQKPPHTADSFDIDAGWEEAAQAVREAVIEECAKVCEYGPYTWASENSDRYHIQAEWSRTLQNKIRALKDKK